MVVIGLAVCLTVSIVAGVALKRVYGSNLEYLWRQIDLISAQNKELARQIDALDKRCESQTSALETLVNSEFTLETKIDETRAVFDALLTPKGDAIASIDAGLDDMPA